MKNITKKKKIIILASFLSLLAIILIAVLVVSGRGKNEEEVVEEPTRRRISEPVNVIPVSERPYVSILPLPDNTHLTIKVSQLNKPATETDYILEYQSGTSLQGAEGLIDLTTLPATEEVFLGTCSAGGACTYDRDITGGNLLLRFTGEESYAVKTNWRYIENTDRSTEVASWDAKFQLQSPTLAAVRYSLVFNSPGVPSGLEELLDIDDELKLIADHYVLSTSSPLQGTAEVTIRLLEESPTAQIVGYNGEKWTIFETETDGKEATAQVELMELYTVVE
ncbi:MAG: hypothetical protein XD95_0447 [Microgenomates bacterium 39_7]|nr:MAG: hypothetical protein XD95_0447 [Microgenomates bacterium 39_7]